MFSFILFAAVLLGSMGLIHWYWNKKRDAQDAKDAASKLMNVSNTLHVAGLTSASLLRRHCSRAC